MTGHDADLSRARVRRHPERGSTDRRLIHAILDEGLVGHVGFLGDGGPCVIPMAYARDGDSLILHGSVASRLMGALGDGPAACVAVTLLDGLVLARSTFGHSMNYRSVVCFGRARRIDDEAAKRRALDVLVEHLVPGRGRDAREPDARELAATTVLTFEIEEASAKVRVGPPKDPAHDLGMSVWAGIIPLQMRAGVPIAAPDLEPGIAMPDDVAAYRRPPFPEALP